MGCYKQTPTPDNCDCGGGKNCNDLYLPDGEETLVGISGTVQPVGSAVLQTVAGITYTPTSAEDTFHPPFRTQPTVVCDEHDAGIENENVPQEFDATVAATGGGFGAAAAALSLIWGTSTSKPCQMVQQANAFSDIVPFFAAPLPGSAPPSSITTDQGSMVWTVELDYNTPLGVGVMSRGSWPPPTDGSTRPDELFPINVDYNSVAGLGPVEKTAGIWDWCFPGSEHGRYHDGSFKNIHDPLYMDALYAWEEASPSLLQGVPNLSLDPPHLSKATGYDPSTRVRNAELYGYRNLSFDDGKFAARFGQLWQRIGIAADSGIYPKTSLTNEAGSQDGLGEGSLKRELPVGIGLQTPTTSGGISYDIGFLFSLFTYDPNQPTNPAGYITYFFYAEDLCTALGIAYDQSKSYPIRPWAHQSTVAIDPADPDRTVGPGTIYAGQGNVGLWDWRFASRVFNTGLGSSFRRNEYTINASATFVFDLQPQGDYWSDFELLDDVAAEGKQNAGRWRNKPSPFVFSLNKIDPDNAAGTSIDLDGVRA